MFCALSLQKMETMTRSKTKLLKNLPHFIRKLSVKSKHLPRHLFITNWSGPLTAPEVSGPPSEKLYEANNVDKNWWLRSLPLFTRNLSVKSNFEKWIFFFIEKLMSIFRCNRFKKKCVHLKNDLLLFLWTKIFLRTLILRMIDLRINFCPRYLLHGFSGGGPLTSREVRGPLHFVINKCRGKFSDFTDNLRIKSGILPQKGSVTVHTSAELRPGHTEGSSYPSDLGPLPFYKLSMK